jgi:hypothetical protein
MANLKRISPMLRFVPFLLAAIGVPACHSGGQTKPATRLGIDDRFEVGPVLFADDFSQDPAANWSAELERGGKVLARDRALEIDVPAGCTVWFKPRLDGPVMIEYQATVIRAGGANDRVSDLNCFWMARDSRSPEDIFATHRSGAFTDYNRLRTYYVGLGGNSNTTTRFRRYIGDEQNRPLLPEHDLRDASDLLRANVSQTIRLVACGPLVQFYRDERKLFELNDAQPYTSGWFALRTTANHMAVRHFRVYRLHPHVPATQPERS